MSGKISLYGTFGAIAISIYVMIGVFGGAVALFYSTLIPIIFGLFVYLLYKFLPDNLAVVIMSVLVVIGTHYILGIWSITILYICFFTSYYLVSYVIKGNKWVKFLRNVIIIITFIVIMFIALQLDPG